MKKGKGKIVTITSTKGGVGKTITTLNLAACYEKLGLNTLVIDLDLFGGAVGTYLNSTNDKTIYNLVLDLSYNRYETLDNYLYKYSEKISIISAPKDPRNANKIDAKYIPIILNNAVYRYDVILIDTNHILDEVNVIALDNSDSILYILTNDLFDLKNTKSFISIMKDVGFKNYYVLLNESINPSRSYFSMYDIRSIIKNNIDFTISKSMYIRNIDKYIMDGEILMLNSKLSFRDKKDLDKYMEIAKKLVEEDKK